MGEFYVSWIRFYERAVMQNPGGSPPASYSPPYGGFYGGAYGRGRPPHPRRWLYVGLAVLFACVGVALLLVLLFPASFGYRPSSTGFGPFGLFGAFFLFFLFVFIIIWIARLAMWSSRPRGSGYYGRGGGRRYGAFAIARERYARGEITRDQFDQIMQDLQRRPGYPPPP